MSFKKKDKVFIFKACVIGEDVVIFNEPAVIAKHFYSDYYRVKIKGKPIFNAYIIDATKSEIYNSPLWKAMRETDEV